jgi:hypothetical protein
MSLATYNANLPYLRKTELRGKSAQQPNWLLRSDKGKTWKALQASTPLNTVNNGRYGAQ